MYWSEQFGAECNISDSPQDSVTESVQGWQPYLSTQKMNYRPVKTEEEIVLR